MTHHFLDPRLIATNRGCRLCLGEVTKSPRNPLMIEDKTWESSGDNLYPNILHDPANGLFKLWYTPFLDRSTHNAQTLCYAESTDGVQWTKPELGLVEVCGTKRNNVLLPFITGAGVALDPAARDPSQRFKMTYLIHPELAPKWAAQLRESGFPISRRGGGVGFSADGIHWTLPPDNPILPGIAGDTHNNWLWHAPSRKYVWITRANVPFETDKLPQGLRPSGAERVVKRWESDDFIHWTNGQVVFRASDDDVGRRQYYSMPTFAFGEGFLGLLSVFNSHPDDDTVDLELAWSPDTIHWQRLCPGVSLIRRGASGTFDAGCIYAAWAPLIVDDVTRIYYAGSVGKHGSGLPRRSSLLLATMPRDRFAGLGSSEEGELTTVPVRCSGDQITINADAASGQVAVELQRPDGSTIAGFEQINCESIQRDALDAPARWCGATNLASLKGTDVRLRFSLRNATVYSVRWT